MAELSKKTAGGIFSRDKVLGLHGVTDTAQMDLDTLLDQLSADVTVRAAYLTDKGETLTPTMLQKSVLSCKP